MTKNTNLPAETAGTEATRFNAVKHGILSRYTVLPWEDADEYAALEASLVAEHCPRGPTEAHLVEELAGIIWRKQRHRLGEASAHQRGLAHAAKGSDTVEAALAHLGGDEQPRADGAVVEAIWATPEEIAEELRDVDEVERMLNNALAILDAGSSKAYELAVVALRADLREAWAQALSYAPWEIEERATPDPDGLRRFIKTHLRPICAQRRMQLENPSSIRAQAFGQSLDPDELVRLARYEVHLDRKLERTLAMLINLQKLRRETARP